MSQTTRVMALSEIFDSEMAVGIANGTASLTDEQFAKAYEALVQDKARIIKVVDEAKAKYATHATPVTKDKTPIIKDRAPVETALEMTTRILQEKYGK